MTYLDELLQDGALWPHKWVWPSWAGVQMKIQLKCFLSNLKQRCHILDLGKEMDDGVASAPADLVMSHPATR